MAGKTQFPCRKKPLWPGIRMQLLIPVVLPPLYSRAWGWGQFRPCAVVFMSRRELSGGGGFPPLLAKADQKRIPPTPVFPLPGASVHII